MTPSDKTRFVSPTWPLPMSRFELSRFALAVLAEDSRSTEAENPPTPEQENE